MNEGTVKTFKRLTALAILAVTFTLMGILFASRMDWTASLSAQDQQEEELEEALKSSGILTDEGESPFVAVAAKVKPAVVNITAKKQEQGRGDGFDWGPFREFFPRDFHPDVPRSVTSGGSGIIISRDGFILTNNHVVGDAASISIKTAEGHVYDAEIVGTDPETDVALIQVKDADFRQDQVAELGDSQNIRIGDWAIAIGNPFGLEQTVTVGVISAEGRSNLAIAGGGPSYQNFIQTDASINFGNSGGPLVNIRGQVIGVNTAINTQGQGIGFAIPINMARNVVQQLRETGQVTRGYLGMVPRELDDATREALKIDNDVQGVFVDLVEDNTPAAEGGLESGDIITAINDQPVNDPTQFRFMIAEHKPDERITLDVIREGKRREMSFRLGNRSEYIAQAENRNRREQDTWLGLHVQPLNSQQGQQMDIQAEEGVLVTEVDFNSPAEGKIQAGDVIIEVNRRPVKNMEDYRKISSDLGDTKDAVLFRLNRGGRKTYEAIKP
ncbi:MAG: Do family serine endopeptidase [Candidatus Zixiibacteriota bacterium]|nr:MAG: Do family serine endopeptidase [candidate division Zixibacteria bacterium]